MATNTTATLSSQYQTFFSKMLLKYAVQDLRLNEFATPADLPKNQGAKTVTFVRWGAPSTSAVETLSTEGTKPTSTRSLTMTTVVATLTQYGEYAVLTDILSQTELFDSTKAGIQVMGEDAALKSDEITRNELVSNGTKAYAQGAANWAALAAASAASAKLIVSDILDIATRLKINRAPMFDGGYVAIIPPQVSRDLMNDDDWIEAHNYANDKALFKGELGRLFNIRMVEATNPFIEDSGGSEGTHVAAGDIFSTVITGKQAYGVVSLAGGTPWSPQVIINKNADKSDPLNQTITVGWKAYYTAKVLNADYSRVYKSKSEFSA